MHVRLHSPRVLQSLQLPVGICGNGPNMVLDPPGTQLSHVSSPAKFVEVLDLLCDIKVPSELLKATEVRFAI